MHYHVSRGGQTYGPYTLADLQRYVASGHILLSDLAKNEEMTDWLPVGQILNPAGAQEPAPPAPPQPYYSAPAETAYNAAPGLGEAYPDPPNLHWGLVLLFDLLTFGLFQIVWNFVMAGWLKRVEPTSKSMFYYAAGYAAKFAVYIMVFPIFLQTMHHRGDYGSGYTLGTHLGLVAASRLLWLAGWILRLVARYSFKAELERHFNGPEPIGYHMNGVVLFFFGGIWIQAELNRTNEIKQALRYRAGSMPGSMR